MFEIESGSYSIEDLYVTCVEPSSFITKRASLLVKVMVCFHLISRGRGTNFFKRIGTINKIMNIPHMIKNSRHMYTLQNITYTLKQREKIK
jgi:hypothetical protein